MTNLDVTYITSARDGSSLTEIQDLENVKDTVIGEQDIANKDMTVSLIGVSSAQNYYSCRDCKSKVEFDGKSVTCQKWVLTQKVSTLSVHWVVKLFVEDQATSRKFHLTAFDGIVQQLAARVKKVTRWHKPRGFEKCPN